jgi:hypothetical protein
MTRAGWLPVFAMALLLPACYDFESPIDATPQLSRDASLLGAWRCLSADPGPDDQAVTLTVSAVREREYELSFTELGKPPERFHGYASNVSGSTILNVRAEKASRSSESWNLARYSFLLPHLLRFELVDDEPFKQIEGSSVELRRMLESVGMQPGIYEDFCVCVRIGKGSSE